METEYGALQIHEGYERDNHILEIASFIFCYIVNEAIGDEVCLKKHVCKITA